ncbi:hypothetical protein CS542_08390 [Pedobacter sp. IW39]|nr:hypothetical protein CS542_08390 [Pedobacter sp. IW39]
MFNFVTIGYQDGTPCFLLRAVYFSGTYLNINFLLPRYYYKDKLFTYIILFISLVIVINILNMIFMDELRKVNMLHECIGTKVNLTLIKFSHTALYMMTTITGLTSGIKLSKDHYIQNKTEQLKERLASELSMLKSNAASFFFNTLNNSMH